MGVQVAGVGISLVLALWSLVRVWTGPRVRRRDLAGAAFWGSGSVVVARQSGPGWLVAVAWTVAGVLVLGVLLLPVVGALARQIEAADGPGLKGEILTGLGPGGPDNFTLGVSSTGFLAMRTVLPQGRRTRFARLVAGCPYCFVEEVLGEVDPDAPAGVEAYRAGLARGVNLMAVLTRGAIDGRWRTGFVPMPGNRTPFRAACATHGR